MKKIIIMTVIVLTASIGAMAQKFAFVDSEYIRNNIPAFTAAQQQLDKLNRSREANGEPAASAPLKQEITFDDFTRMDLRSGTILEAEKVPKTRKLIKMRIDLGFEQRTIVSGIAEYFEPGTLPGKKVTVLANLAPRNIKGIESKGMILLSENADGSLHFVEPSQKAENGSEIN